MEKLRREDGINSNTYNLLFKRFYEINEDETDTNIAIALITIDRFTRTKELNIFTNLLKLFYKNTILDISKIKYNPNTQEYEYKDNDIIITFDKLSKYFDDKELKKELESKKRYKKCHEMSIKVSPSIKNSKIVTGFATLGNVKVLHSVIELDENGITHVLDWTRNLKMTKDEYLKLTNFTELSSFEGEKVIDDFEIILENLPIDSKVYTVFRDEIINDMKRNPQIFKPTLKGRKIKQEFECYNKTK